MFVHNISPILVKIGFLEIRWYGVIYALGFLITIWWLSYLRKKGRLNLSSSEISDFVFWLIIGVVLGARAFEVFIWNPSYYLANPLKMLYFWQGGLSFHGGLVGAAIATYFFCRSKSKVTFLEMADALMIPSMIATGLGRIGNFINGELPGRVTSVGWCVEFPHAKGCRHPQMLYSAFGRLLGAFVLVLLDKGKNKPGWLFGWGLVLFGIERLVVDIWRQDILYYGLTTGQWLSIPLVVIGVWIVIKRKSYKGKKTEAIHD